MNKKNWKDPICVFHGNCVDGFTSAWIVRNYFKSIGVDIEFHMGLYGEDPPLILNRDVIIVDFSYKRDVMIGIIKASKSVTILDHHKTALEDLDGLGSEESVDLIFDMSRSGAGITWDYFNAEAGRPEIVDYVEDRDLWKFEFPGTKEVYAYIVSHEYSFENWDAISETKSSEMISQGKAIMKANTKSAIEVMNATKRTVEIGGMIVPFANAPHSMASEIGHMMAQNVAFAVTYFDTAKHRVFSLRSTEDGLDVQRIARMYPGGGGHASAAGFKVSRDHELAKI